MDKIIVEFTKNELELIYDLLGNEIQKGLEIWKSYVRSGEYRTPDCKKAWKNVGKYQAIRELLKSHLEKDNDIEMIDLELLHLINESPKVD